MDTHNQSNYIGTKTTQRVVSYDFNIKEYEEKIQKIEINEKKRIAQIESKLDLMDKITDNFESSHNSLIEDRDIWVSTFDSLPASIVVLDIDRRIKRANKTFIDIIGATCIDDIINKKCSDIFESVCIQCHETCPVKSNYSSTLNDFKVIEKNNRIYTLTYSPICNNNTLSGYVVLGYDVTDKIKFKDTIKKRDLLISMILNLTNCMYDTSSINIDKKISSVIKNTGNILSLSDIYVYKNKLNNTYTESIYKWRRIRKDAPNKSDESLLYKDGYRRWSYLLSNKKIIHSNVDDLPVNEKSKFISRGVKSILVVPIFVDTKWYGFIILEDSNEPRVWDELEINSVRSIVNILGVILGNIDRKEKIDVM